VGKSVTFTQEVDKLTNLPTSKSYSQSPKKIEQIHPHYDNVDKFTNYPSCFHPRERVTVFLLMPESGRDFDDEGDTKLFGLFDCLYSRHTANPSKPLRTTFLSFFLGWQIPNLITGLSGW